MSLIRSMLKPLSRSMAFPLIGPWLSAPGDMVDPLLWYPAPCSYVWDPSILSTLFTGTLGTIPAVGTSGEEISRITSPNAIDFKQLTALSGPTLDLTTFALRALDTKSSSRYMDTPTVGISTDNFSIFLIYKNNVTTAGNALLSWYKTATPTPHAPWQDDDAWTINFDTGGNFLQWQRNLGNIPLQSNRNDDGGIHLLEIHRNADYSMSMLIDGIEVATGNDAKHTAISPSFFRFGATSGFNSDTPTVFHNYIQGEVRQYLSEITGRSRLNTRMYLLNKWIFGGTVSQSVFDQNPTNPAVDSSYRDGDDHTGAGNWTDGTSTLIVRGASAPGGASDAGMSYQRQPPPRRAKITPGATLTIEVKTVTTATNLNLVMLKPGTDWNQHWQNGNTPRSGGTYLSNTVNNIDGSVGTHVIDITDMLQECVDHPRWQLNDSDPDPHSYFFNFAIYPSSATGDLTLGGVGSGPVDNNSAIIDYSWT